MMSRLIKLAEEFNCAVVISNQVVSDPGGAAMFVAGAWASHYVCVLRVCVCGVSACRSHRLRREEAYRRPRAGTRLNHAPVPPQGALLVKLVHYR